MIKFTVYHFITRLQAPVLKKKIKSPIHVHIYSDITFFSSLTHSFSPRLENYPNLWKCFIVGITNTSSWSACTPSRLDQTLVAIYYHSPSNCLWFKIHRFLHLCEILAYPRTNSEDVHKAVNWRRSHTKKKNTSLHCYLKVRQLFSPVCN
jgi:hypothetical protein